MVNERAGGGVIVGTDGKLLDVGVPVSKTEVGRLLDVGISVSDMKVEKALDGGVSVSRVEVGKPFESVVVISVRDGVIVIEVMIEEPFLSVVEIVLTNGVNGRAVVRRLPSEPVITILEKKGVSVRFPDVNSVELPIVVTKDEATPPEPVVISVERIGTTTGVPGGSIDFSDENELARGNVEFAIVDTTGVGFPSVPVVVLVDKIGKTLLKMEGGIAVIKVDGFPSAPVVEIVLNFGIVFIGAIFVWVPLLEMPVHEEIVLLMELEEDVTAGNDVEARDEVESTEETPGGASDGTSEAGVERDTDVDVFGLGGGWVELEVAAGGSIESLEKDRDVVDSVGPAVPDEVDFASVGFTVDAPNVSELTGRVFDEEDASVFAAVDDVAFKSLVVLTEEWYGMVPYPPWSTVVFVVVEGENEFDAMELSLVPE
jgi:hypothetical protein